MNTFMVLERKNYFVGVEKKDWRDRFPAKLSGGEEIMAIQVSCLNCRNNDCCDGVCYSHSKATGKVKIYPDWDRFGI